MKRPQAPPGGKRGGHLTDEDHAVWQGTAETLEPLKRAKGRVHAAIGTAIGTGESQTPAAAAAKRRGAEHHDRNALRAGAAEARAKAALEAPVKAPPPLSSFDRKRARKLSRGRDEVEARIDLHGMRQAEAHAVLRHFLVRCHHDGLRLVLVITGKGTPNRAPRDGDHDHGFLRSEPGVLRRSVPQWLAEPALRQIVVSFTPAAIRHGGEGAYYVHLRRS
jgi:DNA-nicking Smr family endonuclease